MSVYLLDEISRCLNCKNPLCVKGCPVSTPIPEIIQLLKSGNLSEAGEKLFENNPLSMMCSLVCNHGQQCEGNCVLGKKGVPVHFSKIEYYVMDTYFDKMRIKCKEKNGMKVAVIGAGPAGITIAFKLAQEGYEVIIFEAKEKIGGMLQYGIPDYRLPKTILERYRKKLLEIGIQIRLDTTIGGTLEIGDLFNDGYDSVFIGTGVWRPKKLGIPGESRGDVLYAINYLANPEGHDVGETVAVIGAGNTAVDVARTCLRKGARNVTLYARGNKIRATEEEVVYAKLDGADFKFCRQIEAINDNGPVFKPAIMGDDGTVAGYANELEQEYADTTIIAISQSPKDKLLNTTEGLMGSEKGFLITDENGKTTCQRVYASGDVVFGARTVVEAVAFSKKVAKAMDLDMKEEI
ncbi:NAD(P)-dependent oxidoreductase [Lachnospiraceae bacterium NSJ-143]|nr:NAD(P)-dependent oxidoreductase [Lachnospiraceae bacterium NSJ-143]